MGYLEAFSEATKRKSRKIIELEIDEISLVDRAATGERFAVIKQTAPEAILDFLGEENLVEIEADLAKAQEAVLAAFKYLAVYKADLPTDILAAVQVLGKYAAAVFAEVAEPIAEKKSMKKKGIVKVRPTLWPSLGVSILQAVDDGSADTDVADDKPRRGLSKGLKGQGDEGNDGKSENLWPSLCG
ncbi:hypothetical protein KKA53_05340 [Candidatus Dependentiae bacterium]|nr:hypothetical protein [Candidatus Dependentiae bacterium]